MAMSFRHVVERQLDDNALPIAGAKLYFYDEGTTTPRIVYTNSALTTAASQPIVANAAGEFAVVYLQPGAYRYRVYTSANVLLVDEDNVDPGLSAGSGAVAVASGGTGATTAPAARINLGAASSASVTALDTRVTAVEQELNAPLASPFATVTWASSLALNGTTNERQQITLAGATTITGVTMAAGQEFTLALIQDGTGSRAVSWPSGVKFPGNSAPALSTSANAVDMLTFVAISTTTIHCTGIKRQDVIPNAAPDVLIEDRKSSGTAGGTSTAGSQTRVLNTITRNRGSVASLASNQVTFQPGDYFIRWSAPASASGKHKSQLYNITAAAVTEQGSTAFNANTTNVQTDSVGRAFVSLSAATTFEIRHSIEIAATTSGLGNASGLGQEIYTTLEAWKV